MLKVKIIKLFFFSFNFFIWLITKSIPNKFVLKLVKYRPWKIIKISFSKKKKAELKLITKYYLKFLCKTNNNTFSSCLSISISGMVILDIFCIANVFNLGIYKSKEGKKIPHVWLSDPTDNSLFTTGLINKNSVFLKSI